MPDPISAGNPVYLINPFWRIVNVGWRTGLKGTQLWNMGEFGHTADYSLQAIAPTVGDEVNGPGDGGHWVVNYYKTTVFVLKQLSAPAEAHALQAAQMFDINAPFQIGADFPPDAPPTPNFEGNLTFAFPASPLGKCWASFRMTGHTTAAILAHQELPASTSWADLLAAAGVADPGVIPGGTSSIIAILKFA